MMIIAEENGLSIHHGLRKNQTCTDAAMIKLLSFECTWAKNRTLGEVSYNCKTCFDRVKRSQSNICTETEYGCEPIAHKRLMREEITEARQNRTWGAYGDLLIRKGRTTSGGEVQGKADLPALYTLDSSILLTCTRQLRLTHTCRVAQDHEPLNTTMWHTRMTRMDMSQQNTTLSSWQRWW